MVHLYKNNGYNIVIDANSGSVHSVDEVAYDIIGMYEEKNGDEIKKIILEKYKSLEDVTPQEIENVFSDIEELKAQGKLFSPDNYKPLASELKERSTVIKALCLHIAHECNLACKYCFAGDGEYHGQRSLMSLEVGKKAIDFLIENSGTRKNLEVDFFGGEPLMNFEVVKEIVKYARSKEQEFNKNFRFTLTTNGVLLDEDVMDFANKECYNMVLSLDGRKQTNDRLRVARNGKGSYDTIVPKFKKAVEMRGGKNYYIRGTYTHYNTDFCDDILHMADLGFKELAMEPVVAPPEADYALKPEDLPILMKQYDKLALEMLKRKKAGKGFTFFHYMIDLTAGPCVYKRISGCGVGTEYMAVTPWGDLYPCHQFVGKDEFKLGDVYQGVTNTEVRTKFKLCNMYTRPQCDDCFARMFCSGGCTANAFNATGDLNGYYELGCKLHRKRIECAIMMQVAQAEL